jgi:hemolysin III
MSGLAFPTFTRAELAVDQAVHALGVAAVVVAVPPLIALAALNHGALRFGSALVYGLAAIAMLVASAAYNLAPPSPAKEILRRIDHAVIFIMIAGTYTPLVLCKVGGAAGSAMLAAVWAAALGGAALKLCRPRRFERLSIALYLALGWSIVPMIAPMAAALSTGALVLVAVGGGLYTVGVLVHLAHRLPYHNAIWHALVLAAASCHYAAIMIDVALPAG